MTGLYKIFKLSKHLPDQMILFISTLFALGLLSCERISSPLSSTGSNGKAVGVSASDLLRDKPYNKLIIEIDYMPGMKPDDQSVANLVTMLNKRINKTGGIESRLSEIPSGNKAAYSLSDIEAIEQQNRSLFNSSSSITAYFLFLDGDFQQNGVLGIAYRNTSMCIFQKTIQNNSGSLLQPSRTKLETAVMNHEFGHILGLVNVGTPMKQSHQDIANGAHCNNNSCLMYYQVETTDFVANLSNSPVPDFDSNCLQDLQAFGGK